MSKNRYISVKTSLLRKGKWVVNRGTFCWLTISLLLCEYNFIFITVYYPIGFYTQLIFFKFFNGFQQIWPTNIYMTQQKTLTDRVNAICRKFWIILKFLKSIYASETLNLKSQILNNLVSSFILVTVPQLFHFTPIKCLIKFTFLLPLIQQIYQLYSINAFQKNSINFKNNV